MKKLLQAFSLILFPFLSFAQDYSCFTGTTQYYTNSNGYLRCSKIDSTQIVNGNTVHYPFRSARGSYDLGPLDTISGSWMSKTITILPNGDQFFDSYWGDTVLIRTQAVLNDEWILFNDTTDIYYTAKITSIDTQTVLGNLDSVKAITITAHNSSGIIATDFMNNATMRLSKEHGFITVCDLYMFPLHEPDKAFQNGFDFYTDLSISHNSSPRLDELMFNIVNYYPPDKFQIYNHGVGDILEYRTIDTKNNYTAYTLDEIASMAAAGSEIRYTIKRWVETTTPNTSGPPTKTTTGSIYTFRIDNIFWPTDTPEEWQYNNTWNENYAIYYQPDDTSFCMNGTKYSYKFIMLDRSGNATYYTCGGNTGNTYKTGMGIIGTNICYDPPAEFYNMDLIYFKQVKGCGFYTPLSVSSSSLQDNALIYPNPANDLLHIELPQKNFHLTMVNMNGSIIKKLDVNGHQTMDISEYPNGVYFLLIKEETSINSIQKITIAH